MTAFKPMADKRLQNIFAHLSPPVITNVSELSQPSRCSTSCSTSDILESVHTGAFKGSSDNLGVAESTLQCGKLFELECRGPNTDREAKLLEKLMLSRLRKFYTEYSTHDASTRNCEINLVPCRSEQNCQDVAEGHEGEKLETRGSLENFGDTGIPRESERHGSGGVLDAESELTKGAWPARSGITSASAVSSSGNEEQFLATLKIDKKSKSTGHSSVLRVATCEFCDIIQGTAPCFKLYEDELCLCILDINPLSLGHSLILPKLHFSCLEATPPQVAAAMCAAVPLISSALLAATRCDSFNLLVNSGVAAGQVIMHTHFHIIPRCKGDGLWKSESASRRPMAKVQEAKVLANAVRTRLSTSRAGPATQ